MNLALLVVHLPNLLLVQVLGLMAGRSQGPSLGRVLDQQVWPSLLQGSDVNLALLVVHLPNLLLVQVDHCYCQSVRFVIPHRKKGFTFPRGLK